MSMTLGLGVFQLAMTVGPLVSSAVLDARPPASCERPNGGFYWSYDQVPEHLRTPPGFYWSHDEVPAAFKRESKICLVDGSCVTSLKNSRKRN